METTVAPPPPPEQAFNGVETAAVDDKIETEMLSNISTRTERIWPSNGGERCGRVHVLLRQVIDVCDGSCTMLFPANQTTISKKDCQKYWIYFKILWGALFSNDEGGADRLRSEDVEQATEGNLRNASGESYNTVLWVGL